MDVSPIQRLAMAGQSSAATAARETRPVQPTAQAVRAPADQEVRARATTAEPNTTVVVSFNAASLGYVTRVVDQHTGDVLLQTPPQQVLEMVQKLIERIERGNR